MEVFEKGVSKLYFEVNSQPRLDRVSMSRFSIGFVGDIVNTELQERVCL